MSAAETPADPVQRALSALVGATERLGRMAGESLDAAQVTALRPGYPQPPTVLTRQTEQAVFDYLGALLRFSAVTAASASWRCAKAPLIAGAELVRLDEVRRGDTVQVMDGQGAWGEPFVVGGIHSQPCREGQRFFLYEDGEPNGRAHRLSGLGSDNVRRQVPAVGDPWAAAPVVALHERETPEERAERMDAAYDAGCFGLADGIGGGR